MPCFVDMGLPFLRCFHPERYTSIIALVYDTGHPLSRIAEVRRYRQPSNREADRGNPHRASATGYSFRVAFFRSGFASS